MSVFANLDASVTINSVDLSDHVKSAESSFEAEQLDSTGMGATWTSFIGGLKSGTLSIEFMDDFAAGEVDATLWPLFGTVTTFVYKPSSGAVSATNPSYSGSILISQHTLGGALGELAMKSLTFQTSGTITRATS